jgi:hypothetical protein
LACSLAQSASGYALATTDDFIIMDIIEKMLREWIGAFEGAPEARLALECATEPRRFADVDLVAKILQNRQGGTASLKLRDVSTSDARSVTGKIYLRNGRARLRRPLWQPLALDRIEHETAACEIGQLRLAAQPK